jgi:hypothetical protein
MKITIEQEKLADWFYKLKNWGTEQIILKEGK